jgi:DNA-binding FrmR family transcriptional regulator
MGFRVRIMPGVSVRASSRGFGVGVGPRIAGAHVGTGGIGVSSGIGPFSAYGRVAGGRSRSSYGGYSRGPSRASIAALERAARQAQRDQEIQQVAAIERALVSFHLQSLPPLQRQQALAPEDRSSAVRAELEVSLGVQALADELDGGNAPPAAPPIRPVALKKMRAQARAATTEHASFFQVSERRRIHDQIEQRATELAAGETARREQERAVAQAELKAKWARLQGLRTQVEQGVETDRQEVLRQVQAHQEALDQAWSQLVQNDPHTVVATLEDAFADNDVPSAPIDCVDARATVTLLFEHPDLIPDQVVAETPSGRPTLHKRTKTERNQLYLEMMASHVLATVRGAIVKCCGFGNEE